MNNERCRCFEVIERFDVDVVCTLDIILDFCQV